MTQGKPSPPAPAPNPGGRPWLAVVLIVAGLLVVAVMTVLAGRNWRENTVDGIAAAVIAEFQRDLPKDYGNGLVLERVSLQPGGVLMLVRSTRLSLAEAARDPASLAQVRKNEKDLMLGFCRSAEVRKMLRGGMVLTRRYVDVRDRLFFEVTLGADDCRPQA